MYSWWRLNVFGWLALVCAKIGGAVVATLYRTSAFYWVERTPALASRRGAYTPHFEVSTWPKKVIERALRLKVSMCAPAFVGTCTPQIHAWDICAKLLLPRFLIGSIDQA